MSLSVCLPLPRNGSYQSQWDYILSSFPPDELYVFGDESEAPTTNVFSALDAVYLDNPSQVDAGTFVLLAQDNGRYIQGDENLVDFVHPENVVYMFGHDTRWVDEEFLAGRVPDHKVYVPTASTDDLWSWQAYGITVWDRMMKSG